MPREKPTFQQLVEQHGPFVRRTLAQLGVSARDIADVEQEVFRGVDRGLSAFDPGLSINPETAVRGWLFGICERQARSHRRAEVKRGEVLFSNEELDFTQSAVPTVEDELIDQERKELLLRLLACLEPHRRAVVIAYELEGIPMAEVAAALSIPVNTAWNRLRLGREDLRAAWRRMSRKEGQEGAIPPLALLSGDTVWSLACDLQQWVVSHVHSRVRAARDTWQSIRRATSGDRARGGASRTLAPGSAPAMPAMATAGIATAGVVIALALPFLREPAGSRVAVATPPLTETETGLVATADPLVATADPSAGDATSTPAGDPAGATSPSSGGSGGSSASGEPAPDRPPGGGPAARQATTAPSSEPVKDTLAPELRRMQEAVRAFERGDVRNASTALEAHERAFAEGRLVGEREVLTVRILVSEGRLNEARDRVRTFLRSHPDSPFRAQLEQAVAGR